MRARFLLVLLLAGCPAEKDDHVDCVAPGGCSAVLSTLGTGEYQVDVIADGEGGAYAALLGRGPGAGVCPPNQVCHGELWRVDATGEVTWKAKERKSVDRPIRIKGGVAYRTGDGRLAAVSAAGERLWTLETGDALLAAAAWAGDVFVLGGGQARRLRADTGEVVWAQPFATSFAAPPAQGQFPSRVVFCGVEGSSIVARGLEYSDGAEAWEATLSGQLSAPAVVSRDYLGEIPDRGPVMVVSDRLSLRRHDGSEVWGYDSLEGFRYVLPTEDGGWLAMGPLQDNVTRFRDVGTILWSGPQTGPVVWLALTPDRQVLVGQADGVVRKVNQETGGVFWQYGGVDQVKAPAPPLFREDGNIIFWGANTGEVSDTNLTTLTPAGQGLERWDAGARITSVAISGNGDTFVAVSDGRLYLRRGADL